MILRDLYRCPTEDLHKALAASSQTVIRRGIVEPGSAIEPADVDYLLAYPDFDPSLSFLAYDAGEPVGCLVSRIEPRGEGAEAVWSLLAGRAEAAHAREMLLDEALDHWKQEGTRRARKGVTGLLGSEPRLTEDTDLVDLLKDHGFEIEAESVVMSVELKRLALPEALAQRQDQLRQKGYVIREARPDEVPLVARQYHPRQTGVASLELWNDFIRRLRPEALFVAEFRRQLCGYGSFFGPTLDGDSPALGPSFVDEVHRSTGLPGVLLHHALAAMKQAGKACATVHTPANRTRVYEHAGFTVESRFCHHAVAELD